MQEYQNQPYFRNIEDEMALMDTYGPIVWDAVHALEGLGKISWRAGLKAKSLTWAFRDTVTRRQEQRENYGFKTLFDSDVCTGE